MNASPSMLSHDPPADLEPISTVRTQAAFVRALLDEIERVAPAGEGTAITAQLAEELARLGSRCIATAMALSSCPRRR